VLPGQIIELDFNGHQCGNHSLLFSYQKEIKNSSLGEVQHHISELLDQSIQRRLMYGKAQPVCLLSGGIDSTVVARYLT